MLRGYTKARFRVEGVAALSLWAVTIPQALAYGELAGVPAVAGLYTALAGMLLYGLFGSSRYLNVGPESSVAIVVSTTVAPLAAGDPQLAVALAAMLALLAGGWLLVGALLRLGFVTRLLSTPILAGYLAGAAVIVMASQVPKLFGIASSGPWWERLWQVASQLDLTNAWDLGIGLATIAAVLALKRFAPRLPVFLIALALATIAVSAGELASIHGVAVVGKVPTGVPIPSWPQVGLDRTLLLLGPAASIALLIVASSLATAGALADRDHEDLEPTREFVGLAAAGLGAGLLQGFPANASDSRSFIVAGSGARTQGANLLGGAMVLVTLLLLTPLFRNLPIAALGAVVLVSAVALVDVKQFQRLWRVRRSDFALAIITFAAVLAFGVLGGIGAGVAVSLFETLRRAILPHTAVLGLLADTATFRDITDYQDAETVPGLIVYRFDAPLFFANAEVFRAEIKALVRQARYPIREVVVNAEGITDMDVTGAEALGRVLDDLHDQHVCLIMARVRSSLRQTLALLGLEERIGPENFFMTVLDAAQAFSPDVKPTFGGTQ